VAGKAVRCAHCRQIVQVPAPVRPPKETRLRNAPNSAAAVPIVRPIAQESPARPREPVAPPRRRGSALVALFVMGFIGLLLFAVVGLIGAGAWYYMDSSGGQTQQGNGSASGAASTEPDEPASSNPGELSPRALDRLKRLTVFVKADFGIGESQGSGFLVRVENRIGYVVTNDHVVRGNPDVDQFDRPGRPAGPRSRINPRRTAVVFNSGTPQERTVACQIVATVDRRDLAI
jgi:S1-C subfamily serine protease